MTVVGEFVHHILIVIIRRKSPAAWTCFFCKRNTIENLVLECHIPTIQLHRHLPMWHNIHFVFVVLANPDVIKYLHYRVVVLLQCVILSPLQSLQVFVS